MYRKIMNFLETKKSVRCQLIQLTTNALKPVHKRI